MFAASALTSVSFLVGASVMGTCKTHGVHELVSKVVVVVVGKVLVVVLVLVAGLDVAGSFSACCVVTVTVLVVTVVLVVVTVVVVVVVCCGSCGSNHCRRWVEEAIVKHSARRSDIVRTTRPDPTMAL